MSAYYEVHPGNAEEQTLEITHRGTVLLIPDIIPDLIGRIAEPVDNGVNSIHIFQENLYRTKFFNDAILLWISGTVTFDMMEREKMIFIPITDDDKPELSEFFTVVLTKIVGGARLTSKNKKVIEILGNDYANGLFRCVIIIICFTGNSIFHLSLELLTDFAKKRRKVA